MIFDPTHPAFDLLPSGHMFSTPVFLDKADISFIPRAIQTSYVNYSRKCVTSCGRAAGSLATSQLQGPDFNPELRLLSVPSVACSPECLCRFPLRSLLSFHLPKTPSIQFLFLLFYTASRRAWRPRTRRAWNLSQVTQGTRCGGHPRRDSIPLRSLTHVHTLETIQDANQPTEHAFGLEEETGVHSGERASGRVNVCTGLAWILLPYARCSPNRSQIHRNPDHDKALAYWGWINEY